MVIARHTCVHHPDRLAIGVCVITRQPICAECSTRYEGFNYSKEGLRILQQRRASANRPADIDQIPVVEPAAKPVIPSADEAPSNPPAGNETTHGA
jgi:hypothetical protein